MRAYELGIILNGNLDETVAHELSKTIAKQLTGAGAHIVGSPDWWGRRRLAYPIKKCWDGYYVFFNLLAEGGALDDVERSFRIADNVFRHLLLRLPDAEAGRRGMTEAAA